MLMMCVWRGSMVICVCIWRVSMMLMHVCMERIMICSCVYGSVSLSLVFVCEQVAICFAKMLIHFHFGKTLAFRKGPNFRIGHAEIFYRPLHACMHSLCGSNRLQNCTVYIVQAKMVRI